MQLSKFRAHEWRRDERILSFAHSRLIAMRRRPLPPFRSSHTAPPVRSSHRDLLNGTVILSALTWTSYLVGVVYQQVWLDSLGINSELYPAAATEYFVFAVYAYYSTLAAILSPILKDVTVIGKMILIFSALTAIGVFSVLCQKHRFALALRSKIAANPRFKSFSLVVVIPILGPVMIFYVLLLLSFVLTVPIVVGTTAGKREAQSNIEMIASGCDSATVLGNYCTVIKDDGKSVALGLVVAASDKYIAVVEKTGSRSVILDGKELFKLRPDIKR